MRHRSPSSAPVTSSPAVVRFSPKVPSRNGRPSSAAQASRSSRAYAYTAWSGPPWWTSLPMVSPPSPLLPFAFGADTSTGATVGCLSIPVSSRDRLASGRGTARLTERSRPTAAAYAGAPKPARVIPSTGPRARSSGQPCRLRRCTYPQHTVLKTASARSGAGVSGS